MFYHELLRFNGRLGLISKRTEIDADISHILDCIVGGRIVLKGCAAQIVYDICSGNGLPGVVMALLDSKRKVFLLDPDERKTEFLKLVIGRLELKNAQVVRGRFEDLEPNSVECGVSRGNTPITKSLLVARKPFKIGGEYFHFKSSSWVREVAQIPSQICSIWGPRLVQEYELPVVVSRMAIVGTKRRG
jgi:16S rRNA (guanine527-N7)-methyltransferase